MKSTNCLIVCTSLLMLTGCSGGASAPAPDTTQNESPPATTGADSIDTLVENTTEKPPVKKAESPGLAIGEKAPAFGLVDQNGQKRSLADILAKGNAALVFYRSADW